MNIFRVGEFVRSVNEDIGWYMNMSNGIEGIFEMEEIELFIFVVMNEYYLILMMFGCI